MFMTLGNIATDAAAGLTFIDFDRGEQLCLTGAATLDFDDPAPHDGSQGRLWTFRVTKWQRCLTRCLTSTRTLFAIVDWRKWLKLSKAVGDPELSSLF